MCYHAGQFLPLRLGWPKNFLPRRRMCIKGILIHSFIHSLFPKIVAEYLCQTLFMCLGVNGEQNDLKKKILPWCSFHHSGVGEGQRLAINNNTIISKLFSMLENCKMLWRKLSRCKRGMEMWNVGVGNNFEQNFQGGYLWKESIWETMWRSQGSKHRVIWVKRYRGNSQ